jgi:hypothetical protein
MPTEPLTDIDQMIDSGEYAKARTALGGHDASKPEVEVLVIKLGLTEGSLSSHVCMQKLIEILRRHPDTPGAKELYQKASSQSYKERSSTYSHSHPPPPVGPDDDTE